MASARPIHVDAPVRNIHAPELVISETDLGVAAPSTRTTPLGAVPYDCELIAGWVCPGADISAGAAYWTVEIQKADGTKIAEASSESADLAKAGTELTLVAAEVMLTKGTTLFAVWTPTGAAGDLSAQRNAVTLSLTAGRSD